MQMLTGSCIPGKPYLVTLYGAAGSGKSMLARAVVESLGAEMAARVPTDYFFVPRGAGEPLAEYLARPLAWDWHLLRDRLALPLGTDATTPDADFETFTRVAETGGRPLPIRPLMLIDAMAPFPDAQLIVGVHAPEAVRQDRIALRDERWGTRVRHRWAHLELTWDAVPPVAPDLLLDATRPVHENAAELVSMIRERIPGDRRGGR